MAGPERGREFFPALRVNQLDSAELAADVDSLVFGQYQKLLDFVPDSILRIMNRLDPEVEAGLKAVLWWYTMRLECATTGQQIMDMRYRSDIWSSFSELQRWQKIGHFVLCVVFPWLRTRMDWMSERFLTENNLHVSLKIMDWLDLVLKVGHVIHFFVFLVGGRYRSVTERILRIRAGHNEQPRMEEIDFESMNRELLWHGFADVLIFLLPLVNFRRIWNAVKRKTLAREDRKILLDARSVTECSVCRDFAILPQFLPCSHVFCYYCLQGNLLNDPSFCCPDCGAPTSEILQEGAYK